MNRTTVTLSSTPGMLHYGIQREHPAFIVGSIDVDNEEEALLVAALSLNVYGARPIKNDVDLWIGTVAADVVDVEHQIVEACGLFALEAA